jgi:beta-N-acetylhexosaminidase
MPQPVPLTPADTSGSVEPGLAAAMRARHGRVDEIVTGHAPSPEEIAGAVEQARRSALVVVGTTAASLEPAQAKLVRALLGTGVPVVTVALGTPWELAAYPEARTHVATYGLLRPQLDALVAGLWGSIPFRGQLPVAAG